MPKYAATLFAFSHGKISARMVLDTKHRADKDGCRQLVIRITKERKCIYVNCFYKFTEDVFVAMCEAQATGGKKYKEIRDKLKAHLTKLRKL